MTRCSASIYLGCAVLKCKPSCERALLPKTLSWEMGVDAELSRHVLIIPIASKADMPEDNTAEAGAEGAGARGAARRAKN